ncbi:MAG: hypothetical protein JO250_03155 [Armatimonadetes bacterium]|nr:hypothetical protein [Armatimonadota bacterium]
MKRTAAFGVIGAIILALIFFQTESKALTVRVDASGGAPRLVVNGRPVRARMFFGIYQGPQPAALPIRAGAQRISFQFTAIESEPTHATMHFRFSCRAG